MSGRATQLRYAARGKCQRCGERKPKSDTLCSSCLRSHNAATAALKAQRLANGRCRDCGDKLATSRYCRSCQDKQNDRVRGWRERAARKKR